MLDYTIIVWDNRHILEKGVVKMIVLETFPSNNIYNYTTKQKALKDIRSNGLKSYQYILIDNINNTTYKGGLWLSSNEIDIVRGFKTITRGIRYIKYIRRNNI